MNKQEFLQRLERCLADMEPNAIREILEDFEGFFQEALLSGKEEDQVCLALGEPDEIADRIREEAVIFGLNAAAAPETDAPNGDMKIILYSMSLHCAQSDGPDFQTVFTKGGRVVEDDTVVIRAQNGGLEIQQPRPESFVKKFFNTFDHKTLHVNVPKHFQGDVSIRMAHGNLTVDQLSCKTFKTELLSGNINISRLTAAAGELSSASGNLHMNQCSLPATVTGRSGNIEISSHTGTVNTSTFSGNNYVETDRISAPAVIETRSGNLRVQVKELDENLTIKGQSGNISVTVEALHANLDAKTKSGNIKAYFSPEIQAVFSTASSEFKNDFPNAGLAQTGVPVVSLYTKSGLVRVKKL